MVGKDQTAISEYEHGKRRLFITDLPVFAEKLNVPIIYFFEGEAGEDDLDRALLDVFHQLPPNIRSQALQMLYLLNEITTTLS